MDIHFPKYKKELIALDRKDQSEIRGHYQKIQAAKTPEQKRQLNDQLAKHCHERAQRMQEILKEIKEPTIENIGLEGSKAVSLLALHAYLPVLKMALRLYEKAYQKDPSSIYFQAIPPLTDRIMILQYKKQLFGTNWSVDKEGNFYLIPVKDFPNMNKRRARYGLEPAKKPVVLSTGATKHPLGTGKAQESDQKELTDEEYEEYARYYLKRMA